MKKSGIIMIAFLSVIFANAQTKNFIDQPYIDTTAKVDTLVIPDRIFVTIILQEEDSKGKISLENLEKKMKKVLKNSNVNLKEDLELKDMSSNFKKYFLKNKDIHKSKSYALLLYDTSTAQKVLLELEKVGISNVFLEKTEYSKMDELELVLKTKAVEKAKIHAEYLTLALGQEIGKAIYIMDRNQQHNNFRTYVLDEVVSMGYTSGDKNKNQIEVEFEKLKFETTISVKFELK